MVVMKITIVGGTGLIGTKLCNLLREAGHQPLPASPNSGVDTLTGEGLAEALAGAQVVVDVSNSPSFADDVVMRFFTTSTQNLLAAEAAAGVPHHVALSVVGCDRLPDSGYLRAKVAQETLIRASAIPHSIVQATQFFEFVKTIADACTVEGKVRLPPVGFQPVAADDVARVLAGVATRTPLGGSVELGGPELFRFDELVRQGLAAAKDLREVVSDPGARYFGTSLGDRSLVPGAGSRQGEIRFAIWLANTRR
jgi:uncharacterized protein YbjT (DUF2867 family)